MSAPGLEDAERELARARRELDLAATAADDGYRSGRYRQAAQALSSAGRIMSGLAGASTLPGAVTRRHRGAKQADVRTLTCLRPGRRTSGYPRPGLVRRVARMF
jgi:hypothetical protein